MSRVHPCHRKSTPPTRRRVVIRWALPTTTRASKATYLQTKRSSLSLGSRAAICVRHVRSDHSSTTYTSKTTIVHKVSPNGSTSEFRIRAKIKRIDWTSSTSWSPTRRIQRAWSQWCTRSWTPAKEASLDGSASAKMLPIIRLIE